MQNIYHTKTLQQKLIHGITKKLYNETLNIDKVHILYYS